MSTTVLQKGFKNSGFFDKAFIIEMNEAPGEIKKDFPKRETHQDLTVPAPGTPGKLPHQGSIASLESRTFVDQSEDQPLTEVHVCSYEECHKLRSFNEKKFTESQISSVKNKLFILLIVLLVLWIIIYTVLSQLKVF